MLQDTPFDLTKYVPPWLAVLGWLAFGAYVVAARLRKWRSSDDAVRAGEIEKAVKPYKELADNAEHLARQRKDALEDEQRAHGECEKKVERLSGKLTEEIEAKDRLQFRLMEVTGRLDNVEGRLARLEGDKGARR